MSGSTVTIELNAGQQQQLKNMAQETGKSEAALAQEALETFLDYDAWKCREIEHALQEMDQGDYASDGDVKAIFDKWKSHAG